MHFGGSPVFGAIINSGIVSFQQANFSRSGTYGVDGGVGRAHVYTSYFAQEILDTVTLNGYARLGMYGNLIELTNNYYISGFRFDKEERESFAVLIKGKMSNENIYISKKSECLF